MNRNSRLVVVVALVLVLTLAVAGSIQAQEWDNGQGPPRPAGLRALDVALATDVDWYSTTAVPPAFFWGAGTPTYSSDTFQFRLGCGYIDVTDAFASGDRFEVYDNGVLIGTTSVPISGSNIVDPETAFNDPALSSGRFELPPGDHDIQIRVIANPFNGGRGYVRVISCQDLRLWKELVDGSAPDGVSLAGEDLIYRIGVQNKLPDAFCANVVVSDDLPPGAQFLGAAPDVCQPSASDPSHLDCTLGEIGGNQVAELLVKVRFDPGLVRLEPDGTVAVRNSASVTGSSVELDESDNRDEVSSLVQDAADLSVTKVSTPDSTVQAGETFTYTLYVDNAGPSWARGVFLVDDMVSSGSVEVIQILDDPRRFDLCGIEDAIPPQTGKSIRCELWEPLEPFGADGGTGRWRLQVVAQAAETQDLNNTVRVGTGSLIEPPTVEWENGTPDPDPSNNVAVDTLSVQDAVDLEITKEADSAVVTAGEVLQYTLVVTNAGKGLSTAQNVVVYDSLPAGVELVALSSSVGTCVAGTPGDPTDPTRCVLGEMAVGQTETVVLEVRVAPDLPVNPSLPCDQPAPHCRGRLFNDAWVEAQEIDVDLTDNLATLQADVRYVADVQVFKSGVPDTVDAGEKVTYNVVVNNAGPSMARELFLVDELPDELELLSAEVLNRPARCTLSASNQVLCALGDLMPGSPPLGQVQVLITARVRPDTPAGTVKNLAQSMSYQTYDPQLTNNQDQEETIVQVAADLEIRKSTEPSQAFAGEEIKYTIEVENHGPSDAVGVQIVDTLPAEVAYRMDTGLCDEADGVVTCTVDRLPAGATFGFDIWALVEPEVAPETVVTNQAEVTASTGDPNDANNTTSSEHLVLTKADLRITKFGSTDGQVRAGENLTYTILIENLGPSYAHQVTLRDLLQSGGTFEVLGYDSSRPAACDLTPGEYTEQLEFSCLLTDPLEVQGSESEGRWIVSLVVAADETQDISNVASVASADAADPDLSNNQASVKHDITAVADMGTSKCIQTDAEGPWNCVPDGPVPVVAGKVYEFRAYVTNHGPSTAENVELVDVLPRGMSLVDITPSGYQCAVTQPSAENMELRCGFPNLGAGESLYVQYQVMIDPSLPKGSVLSNGVHGWSEIYDPTAFNQYDEVLVSIEVENSLWIDKQDGPDPVPAGAMLEYTITAGNDGPSTAWDVWVEDSLPEGVQLAAVDSLNWPGAICTYSEVGHEVRCWLQQMQPGDQVELLIRTMVDAGLPRATVLWNEAIVRSRDGLATAEASTDVWVAPRVFLPIVGNSRSTPQLPDLVVESIGDDGGELVAVVKNQGLVAVEEPFWVDLYLDPAPAPAAVNELWQHVALEGMVWRVGYGALPLGVGQTLALRVGDDFFWAQESLVNWPIEVGTTLYAQVDSTGYLLWGEVQETHELKAWRYNNVLGPVLVERELVQPASVMVHRSLLPHR